MNRHLSPGSWPALLVQALACLLLAWALATPAHGQAAPEDAVTLGADPVAPPLWPALRVRTGLPADTDLDRVLADRARWQPVHTPAGNLGPQPLPVAVAFDLVVAPGGGGAWMLDIDYPSLDHVELSLRDSAGRERRWVLGDLHPYSQRAVASRALAVPLQLQEGERYQVAALVRTTGGLILPIRLVRPETFRLNESRDLLLQGLLGGAMFCLLVYALAQGHAMRERAFLWFALNVLGTSVFFFSYHGLGVQHVWGDNPWAAEKMTMVSALLGLGSAFLYVDAILGLGERTPWLSRTMQALAVLLFCAMGMFALGLIGYRSAHTLNVLLSPAPLVLALPTAWRQARAGDPVARYLLLGWAVFGFCAMCFTLLQRGVLPFGFWVGHAFQFGTLAELVTWMVMLGMRTHAARMAGELAVRERDLLATLAHSDALTGLLNRRGLQAAATPLLAGAPAEQPRAVFLIDLDRFKPINDTHGHDVGDAVLTALAGRLKSAVRSTDLVARIGGDEFVVVTGPLSQEGDALTVAAKLQQAVVRPFDVAGRQLDLGMTIGYALTPQDGRDLQDLLKRADQAMYAGKVAGRGGVQRAVAADAAAAAPSGHLPLATR